MFNPLSVIIIAASFWLFPSLLLSLSAGRYRIPSYTLFIIYIWIISGFNNNHQIRIIESSDFEKRPSDVKYAKDWITRLVKEENATTKDSTHMIPIYLILDFEETQNGTLVKHDLQLGYKKTWTGFVDWFIRSFIFTKSKQKSQDRHAIEEFKNLEKQIVEKKD